MSSKDKSILSPVSQKEFWSELRPDLSDFLDMNEEKESWTYKYNEVPDLFLSLSAALPKVASLPPTGEAKGIIEDLIPILSSLPMRESISAIMWMDRAIINEGEVGWGVILYMTAAEIFHNNEDHEIYLQSKIMYDRVRVLMKSKLSSDIFLNIKPLG